MTQSRSTDWRLVNRVTHVSDVANKHVGCRVNKQRLQKLIRAYSAERGRMNELANVYSN